MNELSYEKVKELYVNKHMSIAKCAKECGVSAQKMSKYLVDNGLRFNTKSVSKSNTVDLLSSDFLKRKGKNEVNNNLSSKKDITKVVSNKKDTTKVVSSKKESTNTTKKVSNSTKKSNKSSNKSEIKKSLDIRKGRDSKSSSVNKSKVNNTKPKSVHSEGDDKPITLTDKIIYCNNKYGYNCWRFMDRQELKEALMMDLM